MHSLQKVLPKSPPGLLLPVPQPTGAPLCLSVAKHVPPFICDLSFLLDRGLGKRRVLISLFPTAVMKLGFREGTKLFLLFRKGWRNEQTGSFGSVVHPCQK